jgi:hypothetical protein
MVLDVPTRADTRRAAQAIFRRGEFQRRLSLLDRFLRWLEKLFHFPTPKGGAGGSSGGPDLLLFVVLVALVALLVWVVVVVVRTWVRTPKPTPEPEAEPVVDRPRTQREWRTEAESAETDQRWKDAILARYRELVAELVDRRVVESVPGRTTGELRADVAANAPLVAHSFDEATTLFELPWYAHADTGPTENARFKQLAQAVLDGAAPVGSAPAREREAVAR